MNHRLFPFLRRNPKDGNERELLILHPGEHVRIRTEKEIIATLDRKNTFEGLPFLPEMRKYCGGEFVVLKRVNKMLVEGESQMKRLWNTVILAGVICEGDAHGGCQRYCPLLWKESWLERSKEVLKRHHSEV